MLEELIVPTCSTADQAPAIADKNSPARGTAPTATYSAAREILSTLPDLGRFASGIMSVGYRPTELLV